MRCWAAVPLRCLLGYPPALLGSAFLLRQSRCALPRRIDLGPPDQRGYPHRHRAGGGKPPFAQQRQRHRSGGAENDLCASCGLRVFSRLCGETDDGRGDPAALIRRFQPVSLRRAGVEISRHAEEVREVYARMGELDALVGVRRCARAERSAFPFEAAPGVRFAALVHPLVENLPNDGAWGRSLFQRFRKSTFIKALAINAVLADHRRLANFAGARVKFHGRARHVRGGAGKSARSSASSGRCFRT